MNLRISRLLAIGSFALAALLCRAQSHAQSAYITNSRGGSLSVVDTVTNAVTATISVGVFPFGVAVSPDGSKVYVANEHSNNVSVIATTTNTVTANIPVGADPIAFGVATVSVGLTTLRSTRSTSRQ